MIYGNEGIYTLMALPETGFYIAIRRKVVYDKVRISAVHKVKQSGIIEEVRQVCSGQNWIKEQRTMGHFYFVRHGQTIWNVEGKICGATDIALTDLGHKQAIETGKKILEEQIHADEILYSPLMRAADTAKHISEMTGIPARVEPRLKEQNFGKWESTPRTGAEFRQAKQSFACSYEGGESMLRLAQRIYNLLDEIKAQSDEKTYILVAHNGIARVVQSYFTDMTNEEFAAYGVKNCEVVRYDF